jgi:hypothetical protein
MLCAGDHGLRLGKRLGVLEEVAKRERLGADAFQRLRGALRAGS